MAGTIFSLLLLPFAHEDFAILLGAYVVVNEIMPVALMALCIYGGMVASDCPVQVGAGAQYLPWLRRVAVLMIESAIFPGAQAQSVRDRRALRVVPGVLFVGFVACGWARVPLLRFTVASLTVSLYHRADALHCGGLQRHARDSCGLVDMAALLLCMLLAIGFLRRRVFNLKKAAQRGRQTTSACRLPPRQPAAIHHPLSVYSIFRCSGAGSVLPRDTGR